MAYLNQSVESMWESSMSVMPIQLCLMQPRGPESPLQEAEERMTVHEAETTCNSSSGRSNPATPPSLKRPNSLWPGHSGILNKILFLETSTKSSMSLLQSSSVAKLQLDSISKEFLMDHILSEQVHKMSVFILICVLAATAPGNDLEYFYVMLQLSEFEDPYFSKLELMQRSPSNDTPVI